MAAAAFRKGAAAESSSSTTFSELSGNVLPPLGRVVVIGVRTTGLAVATTELAIIPGVEWVAVMVGVVAIFVSHAVVAGANVVDLLASVHVGIADSVVTPVLVHFLLLNKV